jgi:hypothetical protein
MARQHEILTLVTTVHQPSDRRMGEWNTQITGSKGQRKAKKENE